MFLKGDFDKTSVMNRAELVARLRGG